MAAAREHDAAEAGREIRRANSSSLFLPCSLHSLPVSEVSIDKAKTTHSEPVADYFMFISPKLTSDAQVPGGTYA